MEKPWVFPIENGGIEDPELTSSRRYGESTPTHKAVLPKEGLKPKQILHSKQQRDHIEMD